MPLLTDPIDLLLDENNDLVIENGDLVLVRGMDAVVQQCRIVLQMFQGEWFLNLDAGIPYFDNILGQKPRVAMAAVQIYFNRELLTVDGVDKVLLLETEYTAATRTLTVRWQVSTEFGDTPVDVINLRILSGGV